MIGYIECPAFRSEKVYFNRNGFDHLLRKNGKFRPINEQVRRIQLISKAILVIQTSSQFQSTLLNTENHHPALFWAFSKTMDTVEIRVVVRQLGDGKKHFFSVIDMHP